MRISVAAAIVCLSAIGISTASDVEAAIRTTTSIPAQGLGPALQALAKDRAFELLYLSDLVDSLNTRGATGDLTTDEALQQLLSGSGLTYRYLDDNTVTILRLSSANNPESALPDSDSSRIPSAPSAFNNLETSVPGTAKKAGFWGRFRLAQNDQPSSSRTSDLGEQEERSPQGSDKNSESRVIDEIVVTGTHIRDSAPVGSPVIVFSREDIERTGAATAQQFLATLPQNFGGGRGEDTTGSTLMPDDQTYGGVGVNLRGLGPNSTLVLVNGRRQAYAGDAEYVDISMIPLTAVERIEVLTDGASAIYGADAVAGVVNIILRDDFRGADTRLFTSTTTQGGGTERQIGQSFGTAWGSGSIFANYEYYDRDEIRNDQREALSGLPGNAAYIPQQKKNGLVLSLEQNVFAGSRLLADASFVKREGDFTFFDQFSSTYTRVGSDNRQYGGALALISQLPGSWESELAVAVSRNKLRADGNIFPLMSNYETRNADARVNGDLAQWSAGTVKVALGLGYREESFDRGLGGLIPLNTVDEYDSKSAYAEILLPLIGGRDANDSARLMLSLAGRHEEYSNFGSASTPKVGLNWRVTPSVQLRASYGESFKVPTISQLDPGNAAYLFLDQPTDTGNLRYIAYTGTNPALDPERATTWTVGLDWSPPGLKGFKAQLTGFDIDYDDRILALSFDPLLALTDPGYAPARTLRGDVPDAAFDELARAALASPYVYDFSGCALPLTAEGECPEPASNFDAIFDFGLRNFANTSDRGLDLTLTQNLRTTHGTFDFGLSATYLFKVDRQITTTSPVIEQVNTIYNPPHFKGRASATWSRGSWSVATFINHTGNYTDNGITPTADVSAWTTVDLNVRYQTGAAVQGTLRNFTVTLNTTNLLDRNPPYVRARDAFFNAVNYDAANADPIGRVVSLSLAKSW